MWNVQNNKIYEMVYLTQALARPTSVLMSLILLIILLIDIQNIIIFYNTCECTSAMTCVRARVCVCVCACVWHTSSHQGRMKEVVARWLPLMIWVREIGTSYERKTVLRDASGRERRNESHQVTLEIKKNNKLPPPLSLNITLFSFYIPSFLLLSFPPLSLPLSFLPLSSPHLLFPIPSFSYYGLMSSLGVIHHYMICSERWVVTSRGWQSERRYYEEERVLILLRDINSHQTLSSVPKVKTCSEFRMKNKK